MKYDEQDLIKKIAAKIKNEIDAEIISIFETQEFERVKSETLELYYNLYRGSMIPENQIKFIKEIIAAQNTIFYIDGFEYSITKVHLEALKEIFPEHLSIIKKLENFI